MENWEVIIAEMSEKIAQDPEDTEALFYRAEAYCEIGEFESAKKDYLEIVKYVDDETAYYNLGWICCGFEEYIKAIEYFKKAMKCGQKDFDIFLYLASSYFNTENYMTAIKYYNKAIKLSPTESENYYYRGYSFYCIGKYKKAILDFSKLIEMQNNNALNFADNKDLIDEFQNDKSLFFWHRATCYQEIGNFSKAIADLTTAIDLNANLADTFNERGLCYFNLDKLLESVEDFKTAIKLSEKSPLQNHKLNYFMAILLKVIFSSKNIQMLLSIFKCASIQILTISRNFLMKRNYLEYPNKS